MSGEEGIRLSDEQKRRQKQRSLAIGLVLAGLVALFYVITLVKMGPGVFNRPM